MKRSILAVAVVFSFAASASDFQTDAYNYQHGDTAQRSALAAGHSAGYVADLDGGNETTAVTPHADSTATDAQRQAAIGEAMAQANRSRTATQHVEPHQTATAAVVPMSSLSASVHPTALVAVVPAATLESATAPVEAPAVQVHNEPITTAEPAQISNLEQSTNQRFSDMGKRVDDNRKRAAVGVAGVAAIASIPQVTDSQSFSIGAGMGDYDNQQSVAVGFSARVSKHIVTKAAVSAGTFGGAAVGAGMSWGW